MSVSFFGIDTSLPDLSRRQKTTLPLPRAVQDALIRAYGNWLDVECLVHPASIKGDKVPLSMPGCGMKNPDGTYGYGWGAIRDRVKPTVTQDYFAELVRQDLTHGICNLLPRDTTFAMLEVETIARPLLPKIAAAAKDLGVYDILGEIVHGYTEESTRGGLHFPFRVSTADPIRRRVLASIITPEKPKTAAEVIGAGFQFVVAPSCGQTHSNGLPYTLIYGSPATICTITPDQQRLIYEAFASINEVHRSPGHAAIPPAVESLDDAVSDFNRRASWRKILTRYGWIECHATNRVFADGRVREVIHWRRPGKSSGTSATTCGATMCCFSSAPETGLPQFDPYGSEEERGATKRSKFQVYAAYEHDGDEQAAKAAIRGMGFGIPAYSVTGPGEREDIQSLAGEVTVRLAESDISLAAIRELIPSAVRPEVLVAAANRERRALGSQAIPSNPLPAKTDPRLRAGFNRLATAVADELQKAGIATLDRTTQTLKRSSCHG